MADVYTGVNFGSGGIGSSFDAIFWASRPRAVLDKDSSYVSESVVVVEMTDRRAGPGIPGVRALKILPTRSRTPSSLISASTSSVAAMVRMHVYACLRLKMLTVRL